MCSVLSSGKVYTDDSCQNGMPLEKVFSYHLLLESVHNYDSCYSKGNLYSEKSLQQYLRCLGLVIMNE